MMLFCYLVFIQSVVWECGVLIESWGYLLTFFNYIVFIILCGCGYSDGLRAGRPGFDFWQGEGSLLHTVQTGSGARPASCPMGTWCDFLGCKAAGP
jgi:hypothetical protein